MKPKISTTSEFVSELMERNEPLTWDLDCVVHSDGLAVPDFFLTESFFRNEIAMFGLI